MKFEKDDIVVENGRVGKVTKPHKNGTVVDVLFDGMDYAIRRQTKDVKKMRSNPRYIPNKVVVFTGKVKSVNRKSFTVQAQGKELFIPRDNLNVLYRIYTDGKTLKVVGGHSSRYIFIRDKNDKPRIESLEKGFLHDVPIGVDIFAIPEWLAKKNDIKNEPKYERYFVETEFGMFNPDGFQGTREPTFSEWEFYVKSNRKLEDAIKYVKANERFPIEFFTELGYDRKQSDIMASQVNNHNTPKEARKALTSTYLNMAESRLKKNPRRKQSRLRYFWRMNPDYVMKVPLIIACGSSKNKGVLPVNQKYAKGWWSTYRTNTPQMPNVDTPVYVLSAKHGILKETDRIGDYDTRLVSDSKQNVSKNERKVSSLVKQLKSEKKLKPQTVLFVGSQVYAQALEEAGFTVFMLENFDKYPGALKPGGQGKKNGALKWYLSEYLPSKRTGSMIRTQVQQEIVMPRGAKGEELSMNDIRFRIQVNGIYKGLVKEFLGLPRNADFGTPRKRLDLQLTQPKRRELLNRAFATATQFGRRHGYVAQRGQQLRLTDRAQKEIAKLEDEPKYIEKRMKEYERTLKLARKK